MAHHDGGTGEKKEEEKREEVKESPVVSATKKEEREYDDPLNLLDGNRAWVVAVTKADPTFFSNLTGVQKPSHLWIGCSDSRVPANMITGTTAGEIFVHRNIANVVTHSDMNLLSVLQYAVDVLQVKHIIVCGHYGCGGVMAAMTNNSYGLVDNWLRNIKDVYRYHQKELDSIQDQNERLKKIYRI